jgi:hypothetical protein
MHVTLLPSSHHLKEAFDDAQRTTHYSDIISTPLNTSSSSIVSEIHHHPQAQAVNTTSLSLTPTLTWLPPGFEPSAQSIEGLPLLVTVTLLPRNGSPNAVLMSYLVQSTWLSFFPRVSRTRPTPHQDYTRKSAEGSRYTGRR